MSRRTTITLAAFLLLALTMPAPPGHASFPGKQGNVAAVAGRAKNPATGGYGTPVPSLASERGVESSSEGYKKIRRRYRVLEFFSLGFLLVMAVIVTAYILRMREKSEKARKLKAETYSVEELDNRVAITDHFHALIEGKTEFVVQFGGIEGQFITAPRSLQEGGQVFLTEPLLPFPGTGMNLAGANAKIDYLCNEVPYSFVTLLLWEPQAARDPVTFRSPHLIKYTQRRHSYRVRPPVLEPVLVIFPAPGGGGEESVLDFSAGGFSLLSEKSYQPGETFREVRLILPGIKPLRADVKCVYHLPPGRGDREEARRFGFQYLDPGVKEEKAFMGFVSESRGRKEKP
ncbi:MAG: hypothetical protein GTN70_08615 [Deltaproteobacteria bacterium]|nr:hypothetical protein [Deltaproteobacteria bacterium]NIS77837.1 hypothetical protein [Deltaproteobacteria bacterium]